jgi:hypothetical protein
MYAPEALSRRVGTRIDGQRLVGSHAAARDLKVQLSGSHAERLLDKITDLPDYRSTVSFSNIEIGLDDPDLGPLRVSHFVILFPAPRRKSCNFSRRHVRNIWRTAP